MGIILAQSLKGWYYCREAIWPGNPQYLSEGTIQCLTGSLTPSVFHPKIQGFIVYGSIKLIKLRVGYK